MSEMEPHEVGLFTSVQNLGFAAITDYYYCFAIIVFYFIISIYIYIGGGILSLKVCTFEIKEV